MIRATIIAGFFPLAGIALAIAAVLLGWLP